MATRRITYKLYPNRQQEVKLHYWRRLHASLYNAAIYNRKTQYQKFGHSVNYIEQQNCLPAFKKVWPEYKELGSHALQATLKRVDFAFARFFKGLGGYPKFKPSRRYSGWTYPCSAGWKAETNGQHGHLNLSNLGRLQMRGKARTWGKPTTCTIVFRNGCWYASITVQCRPVKAITGKAKKGKRNKQKAGLNRSILEVGFGIIGGLLEYKAAEAGGFYLKSPTRTLKPTQRCAKCWELTPKILGDRVHVCSNPNCQHIEDRDVNAAQINITWARGQELASLDEELSSSTSCSKHKATGSVEASETSTSA